MGKNFRETLSEQLKDPEFKIEYDALAAEYQLINAILDARKAANITQKQLAEKTGIAQSDISKIENGNANPSLKTIERIASGMGMTVRVEFVPAKVSADPFYSENNLAHLRRGVNALNAGKGVEHEENLV